MRVIRGARPLSAINPLLVLLLAALTVACTGPADRGDAALSVDEAFVPEVLPPHLEFRVDNQLQELLLDPQTERARGVINEMKQWPTDAGPIRVCFFGGDAGLRKRIVDVASRWVASPAGISLDFGGANGKLCNPRETFHIRVGFRYRGYWSLVGQDSLLLANQGEQSLNLQYFDVAPASEPEFTRKVLHEFGHALGFEHEHQSPAANCNDEFDWDSVYAYLAGPPNRWPRDYVDKQMRPLLRGGLRTSRFDVKSIMLYSFPSEFYRAGERSSCFTRGNNTLSAGDLALLASTYPANKDNTELRAALVDRYNEILESLPEVSLAVRLHAFSELQKYTKGELSTGALATLQSDPDWSRGTVVIPESIKNARPIG